MDKNESRTYNFMADEIRSRLNGRPYSVGLDLGVGSIGVALVALDADSEGTLFPTDIVHASSRIFPSSEGSQDRRAKRGQRNAIRHKSNRLEKLWKALSEKGLMLSFSKEEVKDPARLRFSDEEIKKNPYELRLKGLSEKLTLPELGVALYHIAGHRGSSSVRTFLDTVVTKEEEEESKKTRIAESIASKYSLNTFIEVLYKSKEINNTNFRNSENASEDTPLPTRDIIEKELNKLLDKQAEFYPDILTEEYVNRIKEIVLFENEKLVPEAGHCPYFPEEKKLPKASFINEERRLWEAVNNVRIVYDNFTEKGSKEIRKALEKDEKESLFNYLRDGNDVNQSTFKSMFMHYKSAKKIELQGTTKASQALKGFRFKALENESWFRALTEEKQLSFIETFINCPDDKKLAKKLKDDFAFNDDDIKSALKTQIIDGYAPVGISAMRIIMPYIKEDGLSYQEAEGIAIKEGKLAEPFKDVVFDILPYYGMVIPSSTQELIGKAWHSAFEERRGMKGFNFPNINKDEEEFGKIANPVVHQTLNELRKLMNEVLEITGKKPENITVEIARELKVGKEARDKISKDNYEKEKENKRIFDQYCKPHNLGKKYIKRFKLYEEQNHTCPYCLKTINVSDIVSGNVDIDHILPEADTGDSSYDNLVLAHKTCNESKKAKRIPYAAFSSDINQWRKIEQYLDSTQMSSSKINRMKMTDEEYDEHLEKEEFLPRFKSDNAYIARVAREYLQSLYPVEDRAMAVNTIRGTETGMLRSAWSLNGITNSLVNMLSGNDEYVDKKNRTDHRHHALDAIVAAYFTQKYSTIIQTLSAQGVSNKEIYQRLPIPKYYRLDKSLSKQEQLTEFRKEVGSFIENRTFVSLKQNTSKNGALVKDTQYSIIACGKEDVVISTKKKIKDIKVDTIEGNKTNTLSGLLLKPFKVPSFLSDEEKKKVQDLVSKNKEKYESIKALMPEAESLLKTKNENRKEKGSKEIKITEKGIISKACSMVGGYYYTLDNKKSNKVSIRHSTNSAFDTGENYSLDLYHDEKGKLQGEVIRKVDAIKKDFVPCYKKNGFTLFERLYPKDVLEIDLIPAVGDSKKELSQSIVTANALDGKTFVVIDTFTEVGSGIQVYYSPINLSSDKVESSFRVSGMTKMNVRKITLSSLGLVIYRSKLLKDK